MEKTNVQSEYILEIKNLTKQYDQKVVVDNINLKIKKGEFVTFLGPSGCGKTTTLRMIAGFERPEIGAIIFNGEDIGDLPPYKREVNTVFQKYALFPHLNVYNNIAFGLRIKKIDVDVVNKKGETVTKKIKLADKPVEQKIVKNGVETIKTVKFKKSYTLENYIDKKGRNKTRKVNLYEKFISDKVMRALKIVGLTDYEDRDVNSLSGGQQQRVAIARAIVNEPQILLLDEPLGALDLKMRQEMQLELKSMHKKLGITFIYVTHDQEEALTMSDTIVVMRDGKICQEGSPTDIYNEPQSAYVADFIGESNILNGVMLKDKEVLFLENKVKCVDKGFAENEPVDVVIRPEDWIIKDKDAGIFNAVITTCLFRGVHYEMEATVNGYTVIIHNTVKHEVGEEIGLSIAPFDIQIMKKELYTNTFDAEFISNTQIEILGATYDINLSSANADIEYDSESDTVRYRGNTINLIGKTLPVTVDFTGIDLADYEEDAPMAGNVVSMIYKGKNYLVTVKGNKDKNIAVETPYLWDDGDRVGILINKDNFRLDGSVLDEN